MFSVEKENFGPVTRIKLVNTKTQEYVSFVPDFGGKLSEVVLEKNGELYSVHSGDTSGEAVLANKGSRGNNLTPFPNRIDAGKYTFKGEAYALPINPRHGHAIHGFVFDKGFSVLEQKSDALSANARIEYASSGTEGYPFAFTNIVEYALNEEGFTCTTSIRNDGEQAMPVGQGWHPYFSLGGKVDDYLLKLPVSEELLVNDVMIPTGKKVEARAFRNPEQVGHTELDTGYKVTDEEDTAVTEISNGELVLKIWQEVGKGKYNFLQAYIPKDRNSIAIEPMTCPANAFNSGEGLIVLEPGQELKASYGVRLD